MKKENLKNPPIIALVGIGFFLALGGFFVLMSLKPDNSIAETSVNVGNNSKLEQKVQAYLATEKPEYSCLNTVVGYTNLRIWTNVACVKQDYSGCNYVEYDYDPVDGRVVSRLDSGNDSASNWKELLPGDVYEAYVATGHERSDRCRQMIKQLEA